MKWYHQTRADHVHVRVFMNGTLCGLLTFRVEEFNDVRIGVNVAGFIEFIEE